MQVTLTEREIHAALRKYIIARLRLSATEEIKVDLMATRGVDGFKAVLDIIEPEDMEADAPELPPASEITRAVATSTTAQVSIPTVRTPAPAVQEPVKEVPATSAEQVQVAMVKAAAPVVKAVVPAVVDDIPPFDVPAPAVVAPKVSGLFAHLANS